MEQLKFWVRDSKTLEPLLYDPTTKIVERFTLDDLITMFPDDTRRKYLNK